MQQTEGTVSSEDSAVNSSTSVQVESQSSEVCAVQQTTSQHSPPQKPLPSPPQQKILVYTISLTKEELKQLRNLSKRVRNEPDDSKIKEVTRKSKEILEEKLRIVKEKVKQLFIFTKERTHTLERSVSTRLRTFSGKKPKLLRICYLDNTPPAAGSKASSPRIVFVILTAKNSVHTLRKRGQKILTKRKQDWQDWKRRSQDSRAQKEKNVDKESHLERHSKRRKEEPVEEPRTLKREDAIPASPTQDEDPKRNDTGHTSLVLEEQEAESTDDSEPVSKDAYYNVEPSQDKQQNTEETQQLKAEEQHTEDDEKDIQSSQDYIDHRNTKETGEPTTLKNEESRKADERETINESEPLSIATETHHGTGSNVSTVQMKMAPVKPLLFALYDYDGDISFVQGEVLVLLKKYSHGWWVAANQQGDIGSIPCTFVEELDPNMFFQVVAKETIEADEPDILSFSKGTFITVLKTGFIQEEAKEEWFLAILRDGTTGYLPSASVKRVLCRKRHN
jgi:hypothetical protein